MSRNIARFFSLFFRNRIQCIALYQLHNSQALLNLRRGYYICLTAEILGIIEVWMSEGSGWIIDSVDNNYINVVNYKPLKGSSYIELPEELKNSAKG